MNKINDKMVAEDCSVCGSPVWHHSSDEGTHFYSPRKLEWTYEDFASPLYQTERDKEIIQHCVSIINGQE